MISISFLGRRDSALALLLEAVQHKHGFFELNGVDGAVGSTRIVFDHLQHTGTAKPFNALEASCCSPFWAKFRAWPKNFRIPTGSAIKSFLLLPIQ